MNPSGETLAVISVPSYRQEFEPVPRIQAMPALRPHSARAAASMSLPTSMSAAVKRAARTSRITAILSGKAQPAP